MKERILSLTPRRGRGPAHIKFESIELGAFDQATIQTAAANIGAEANFTYETTTKGDRTFQTLTSLTIVSPATPEATELVTVTPLPLARSQDPTPYVLFDRADDEAIIARIKGAALQAYVYAFKQEGGMVYGLGVDGAEACKRELARTGEIIEEESMTLVKDTNEAGYFEAKASRWVLQPQTGTRWKLDTALGFKRQAKVTPGGRANPFWFEQGCSKALRNAILRLTPEEIKQRVIEAYKASAKLVEGPLPLPERLQTPQTDRPDQMPDQAFLLTRITELSDGMKIPDGIRIVLWDRFIGKGIKPADADPVGLNELKGYLQHRSKTGEWPDAES